MKQFYSNFPRELGRYRTGRANSVKDLIEWVNEGNGKRDQFVSVYGFDDWNGTKRPRYDSAVIDKIYWDADPYGYKNNQKVKLEDPSTRVLRLSYELENDGVGHWLVASGSGLNLYAETTDWPLAPDTKKSTIYAIQQHYDEKVNLEGDSLYGDVARVSRVPRTVNLKFKRAHGRRYCIFINRRNIENGAYIEKMQRNDGDKDCYVAGNKPIDLMYWEEHADNFYSNRNIVDSYEEGIDEDAEFESDWFCVNKAMKACKEGKKLSNGTNRDRFIVLAYMYDTGYSAPEALGICKQNFHSTTLESMRLEQQLKNIYSNGVIFPSPTLLNKQGRCNSCGMC